MKKGRTVFSQLMDFMPRWKFDKCVDRYQGNHRVRSFTCYEQFLCMSFAQLTGRESLREIESCLRAFKEKLYHSGISSNVSRSTLADANEKRDWKIYQDFGYVLIKEACHLYKNEELSTRLKATTYALDSTTIDLCMELFPWAKFRKTKSAVKMHALLDLRGNIPSFIGITGGKTHDVNFLDDMPREAGSFYIMDRAYNDFQRLFQFGKDKAYFIIRAKSNTRFQRKSSRLHMNKESGIRSDQVIRITGPKSSKSYPSDLRRVYFYDKENKRKLVFLTNNFNLAPSTIAKLYKSRWQVELFFKWVKQHLKIKSFYGTSENAVKTQIWIALSSYLLVAIAKQRLDVADRSMYEVLQILDILIFEKKPINKAFSYSGQEKSNPVFEKEACNQPNLFDS